MRSLVLVALLVAGCTPPETPKPLARVEAVFDTPHEYRVSSSLPCADGAGLVYVLTSSAEIHSFDPASLTFTKIGRLSCLARSSPNSMAVDRSGTAWLDFLDGTLFKASTRDASCESTRFKPWQHSFRAFGMAFASTGADLGDETLFVWGGDPGTGYRRWYRRREGMDGAREGLGLARIDLDELELIPIGEDGGRLSGQRAELTGTGDGRLYGYFSTNPATLAELDPKSGAVRWSRPLDGIGAGTSWAFSFWGGSFWFYWAPFGHTSRVSKVTGTDGAVEHVLEDIGFNIVGAGVSTCAPTARD